MGRLASAMTPGSLAHNNVPSFIMDYNANPDLWSSVFSHRSTANLPNVLRLRLWWVSFVFDSGDSFWSATSAMTDTVSTPTRKRLVHRRWIHRDDPPGSSPLQSHFLFIQSPHSIITSTSTQSEQTVPFPLPTKFQFCKLSFSNFTFMFPKRNEFLEKVHF